MRFAVPVLALEGVPTDDGRQFQALDWRDLPLTLYASLANTPGHDGAPIAGSLDEITKADGGVLTAVIDTDDDGAAGKEAARLIQRQDLRGISIDAMPQGEVRDVVGDDGDLVGVEFETATIMAATLTGQPAFADANQIDPTPLDQEPEEAPNGEEGPPESEAFAAEELGVELGGVVRARREELELSLEEVAERMEGDGARDAEVLAQIEAGEVDCPPVVVLESLAAALEMDAGMLVEAGEADGCDYTSDDDEDQDDEDEGQAQARRCAATAQSTGHRCKRQAAEDAVTCAAHGALPSLTVVTTDCQGCEALTAAGVRIDAGLDPDWFADPQLDGPTPVTVTDDGRIFGHLASWKTCHTAFSGVCITPPKSRSQYAYFTTGEVRAGDTTIPVGQITMDTDHADQTPGISAAAAKAHYDNTGSAVADVTAGEDQHGIWIAGAVRPDVMQDPDRLRRLRAATLSGDWRRIGGQLDLVAALCVNVPGFPVPRSLAASGWMVEGVQTSLVAAGLVAVREPEATEDVVRRVIREERDRERLLAQADLAVQPSRDAVLARMDETVGV